MKKDRGFLLSCSPYSHCLYFFELQYTRYHSDCLFRYCPTGGRLEARNYFALYTLVSNDLVVGRNSRVAQPRLPSNKLDNGPNVGQ